MLQVGGGEEWPEKKITVIFRMQSISRKKIFFPLNPAFRRYLKLYEREMPLPVSYEELKYYDSGIPVYDNTGKDTLWESVFYPQSMTAQLHAGSPPASPDLGGLRSSTCIIWMTDEGALP